MIGGRLREEPLRRRPITQPTPCRASSSSYNKLTVQRTDQLLALVADRNPSTSPPVEPFPRPASPQRIGLTGRPAETVNSPRPSTPTPPQQGDAVSSESSGEAMGEDGRRLLTATGRCRSGDEEAADSEKSRDGAYPAPNGPRRRRRRSLLLSAIPARTEDWLRSLTWPRRIALLVVILLSCRFLSRAPALLTSIRDGGRHPIPQLIARAEAEHTRRLASEPVTLHQAYERYLDRHGRPPPKGYDAWYYYARRNQDLRQTADTSFLPVDFFVNQLDEPRVLLPYGERTDLERQGRRSSRELSGVNAPHVRES